LLAITFRFTELDLAALGADRFDVDFRFLLLIVIIIAFVVSLLVAIPAIRRKLAGPARDIWRAMSVLRSPSKFALLLGDESSLSQGRHRAGIKGECLVVAIEGARKLVLHRISTTQVECQLV